VTVARQLSVLVILLGLILGAAIMLLPVHPVQATTPGSVDWNRFLGSDPTWVPITQAWSSHYGSPHFGCQDPSVTPVEVGAVAGGAGILAGIAGLVVFGIGKRPREQFT
jgi:hypothetical protein